MAERLRLPAADGRLTDYEPTGRYGYGDGAPAATSRVAYAAVHTVADALADTSPLSSAAVDWEATLAFRRHVWSFGLGVAEEVKRFLGD